MLKHSKQSSIIGNTQISRLYFSQLVSAPYGGPTVTQRAAGTLAGSGTVQLSLDPLVDSSLRKVLPPQSPLFTAKITKKKEEDQRTDLGNFTSLFKDGGQGLALPFTPCVVLLMTQWRCDDYLNQSASAMCLRQLLVSEITGLLYEKPDGAGTKKVAPGIRVQVLFSLAKTHKNAGYCQWHGGGFDVGGAGGPVCSVWGWLGLKGGANLKPRPH